ncbi:hypothetical protein [Azospirillum sp. TSH64]|uniref:hypothetical protein n=1 Tax=Azospirillum sp. TSH64 TaxID=652740 RepID=UPI000D6123AB|nr:hypothetical protein [Azospirillum sp. TSH64]PWC74054.1 hypothetical protein TSH64_02605 [Azospirillum sp. TSH64]
MKHSPFAGAKGAFAHLLGLRPSGKRAEDENRKEEKSKRAENEEKDEETAEDDEDEEKAEEGDDDAKAEDLDDDDADADTEKEEAKKAKAKGKTYAAGRAAERKRCTAIFASPHAAGMPHVAANLAFTTDLSAQQAITVMAGVAVTGQPQGKRGLGERMANVPSPAVGPDGGAGPEKGSAAETVARMTAAYDRATGGAAKK